MKNHILCRILPLILAVTLAAGCGKPAAGSSTPAESAPQAATLSLEYYRMTDTSVWQVMSFSAGRVVLCSFGVEGDYSIANEDGVTVGDARFRYIYPFEVSGHTLAETGDHRWVYIDRNGKVIAKDVAPPQADTVAETQRDIQWSEQGERWFVRRTGGEALTEPIFTWISSTDNTLNYAILAEGEHRNVMIDPYGAVKATLPDDCMDATATGDHILCQYDLSDTDRIYRLADGQGNLLSEVGYDEIGPFDDGLAAVVRDGKMGLIDSEGNEVVPPTLPVDDPGDYPLTQWRGRIACTVDGRLAIVRIVKQ